MSSSSSSASDSEEETKLKHTQIPELNDLDSESSSSESESSDSNSASSEAEPEPDVPVLSHAEQRRQKKKKQKAAAGGGTAPSSEGDVKGKGKQAADEPAKAPRRQNSVWVGNLAFKTTPDALRRFFDGAGEITRVHMPLRLGSGRDGMKENRGFAYVDFATPDAKAVAITLSEKNLYGRRLLIKDGDDFTGRPTSSAEASASQGKGGLTGHSRTAQRILAAQKQPAGPTLFLGNLSFEATEEGIRALLDSHRPAREDAEGEGAKWIRKVRMGTFEDSGKCKGWAFIDFTGTEHATAVLTNPKNHFLQGRKLVVEYASPDAVRRGGNYAHARDGAKGRGSRPSDAGRKRKAGVDEEGAEQEGAEQPPKRRRREEAEGARTKDRDAPGKGGKPPRPRAAPGAALALAKREAVAIVPSQGTKTVF